MCWPTWPTGSSTRGCVRHERHLRTGGAGMSNGAARIAWARRRQAVAKLWREFAGSRSGLVGLAALAGIVLLALLAPMWIHEDQLSVIKATGGVLTPPSGDYWLGTDHAGRSVLDLTVYGARVSLLVGISAAVLSVGIGTIFGMLSGH